MPAGAKPAADITPPPVWIELEAADDHRRAVRAGVEVVPQWARAILGLDDCYALSAWERTVAALLGAAADRVPVPSSPPAQACRRLGLPSTYLFRLF